MDKTAKQVITMLNAYHELAQTIRPMAQPNAQTEPSKLQTPFTTADNRPLNHLTKLRNSANQQLHTMLQHKNTTPLASSDPGPHYDNTPTPALATKVLHLTDTPKLEDIPYLCHKAIASIISKANRKLMDTIRKKEDGIYKNRPKRYHDNLKTTADLQPRAKDQLNLATVRDPATNGITTNP